MNGFQASDLLSFDKMIATKVMKFVYFVGLLCIALSDLVTFVGSFAAMRLSVATGFGTMVLAVIGTALAVLIWRVMCELWLLGFNMYDRLGEIRDRVGPAAPNRP